MGFTKSLFDRLEPLNENLNILFRVNRVTKTVKFIVSDTSSTVVEFSEDGASLVTGLRFFVNDVEYTAGIVLDSVLNSKYAYIVLDSSKLINIAENQYFARVSVVVGDDFVKTQDIAILF